MKKEIKSVLKKLAGEAPEFPECFKKPFVYGEWIVATDSYSLIRVKSQGNNSGYSPLIKKVRVHTLIDLEMIIRFQEYVQYVAETVLLSEKAWLRLPTQSSSRNICFSCAS